MKKAASIPPSSILKKGQFVDQKYSNYREMVASISEKWEYCCTYQLCPNGLAGHNRILQLGNMLVSLEEAPGGIMYDVISNPGMISLAVLEYVEDKACFDQMKLRSGDIMIFDDARPYTYISSGALRNSIISIRRDHMGKLQPLLDKAILHKIRDNGNALQNTLHSIWDEFTTSGDKHNFQDAENRIVIQIEKILQQQEPVAPCLTSGEEIAFAVCDQVYHHMDGDFSMSNLAEQYDVSEKTLQNSFKSLFGFTPKHFIRALKLNVVRNELTNNKKEDMTVNRIANKWGFMHMGHFSKNYKKLFGETPSQTLKRSFTDNISIAGECVERQEEII